VSLGRNGAGRSQLLERNLHTSNLTFCVVSSDLPTVVSSICLR
jgi:hypothetical protein